MKKIFTTVAAFCLGLFASITIVACADEFADNGGNSDSELQELKATVALLSARVAELEKGDCVTYYENKILSDMWYSATFNYDANGRIAAISYSPKSPIVTDIDTIVSATSSKAESAKVFFMNGWDNPTPFKNLYYTKVSE